MQFLVVGEAMRKDIIGYLIYSVSYAVSFMAMMVCHCYLSGSDCYVNTTVPFSDFVVPLLVIFVGLSSLGAAACIALNVLARLANVTHPVFLILLGGICGAMPFLIHFTYTYVSSPANVYPQVSVVEYIGCISGIVASALYYSKTSKLQ